MGSGSTTQPSPNQLVTPTVSNTSIAVATVNPQRAGLFVFNPSATITLYVTPLGTAAVVGAGTAIQPLQGQMFGAPNTPPWTNGMNAIASSAGANVIVILEFTQ
jgi:hypothetical protein